MISVAHSPDADDIFMYYAIKFGWIDCPIKNKTFHNIALDIETLNQEDLKNTECVGEICLDYTLKLRPITPCSLQRQALGMAMGLN
ncbi:hypothetical protein VN0416_04200 [Helicobacter pylori]